MPSQPLLNDCGDDVFPVPTTAAARKRQSGQDYRFYITGIPIAPAVKRANIYNGVDLQFDTLGRPIWEPIFNVDSSLKGIADGVILSALIDDDKYLDLVMCGTVLSGTNSVAHTGV